MIITYAKKRCQKRIEISINCKQQSTNYCSIDVPGRYRIFVVGVGVHDGDRNIGAVLEQPRQSILCTAKDTQLVQKEQVCETTTIGCVALSIRTRCGLSCLQGPHPVIIIIIIIIIVKTESKTRVFKQNVIPAGVQSAVTVSNTCFGLRSTNSSNVSAVDRRIKCR
jgi:hypothetical protein